MKRIAGFAVVCGALAGAAQANIIVYTMTGQLSATGGDSAGIHGASITMVAHYDDSLVYTDGFGFAHIAAVSGSPSLTMTGAPDNSNNTTVGFNSDLAFYPTFAGTFTEPAGGHTEFFTGNGSYMLFTMNTTPSAGSGNAFIGSPVEIDDFAPASYAGSGMINLNTGESYSLNNAGITAEYIPAPGALALLGLSGLAATRRRR